MRGNLFISLVLACTFGTALTGCVSAPPNDHSGDGFSVVGQQPAGQHALPTTAAAATASSEANPSDADMEAAIDLAEGIPYIRSEPHKVPPFPLALNSVVQRYVDSFAQHQEGIRQSFRRSRPYLPMMMQVMENHDLPPDLVYLSFAESSFSSKGAGPWQLSVATARRFNLRVNRYVDERRDPIKSTRAAADYLAALYNEAGDWCVALVGWNQGETAIDNYWSLRGVDYNRLTSSLPYNTRSLLNRFMAVAIIAREPERYGLDPVNYTESARFRAIKVRGGTPLVDVARSTGVSVRVLHEYNPAILHDRVPPGPSYEIRLPLEESADAREPGDLMRF